MTADKLSIVLLLLILLAAVCIDLGRHRIPNVLSFGGILLGLGLQGWAFGAHGALIALGGLGVALLMFLPFYLLGGMGAGDVKLMAVVGTFLGPTGTLLAAGLSFAVGAGLGVGVLLARRGALAALRRYASALKALFFTSTVSYVPPQPGEAAASRFPYAVAIAGGTVAALWWLSV